MFFLPADEIIKAVMARKSEGHELTSLIANTNEVHAEFLCDSSNRKVLAQESVQGAEFITYAQIKTVIAMMTQNIQPQ